MTHGVPPSDDQRRGPTRLGVPAGDSRERLICDDCGFILYENPKVVVGTVSTWEDRYLLCRRAIGPRKGFWTVPAGYLEKRETVEEGALRETREEACAEVEIDALLAVYSIPRISQVQLLFRGHLPAPEYAAGPESQQVALFSWDELPWEELAFPSVLWALQQHRQVRGQASFAPFSNPPGSSADLDGFQPRRPEP